VKLRVPIVAFQVAGVLAGVLGGGLRGGAIGFAAGSVISAVLAHQVFDRTFRALAGVPRPAVDATASLPWMEPAGGEL
jgi:hypothetical protein